MTYSETLILIPSHSLDDFPTDLAESEAAGLLNAFAVAWHPALLAETKCLPAWHRSDEPPATPSGKIVIIPSICEGWLPHHWADDARVEGTLVVDSSSDRQETLTALMAGLINEDGSQSAEVDDDLVADFLALGSCHLQVELLTRHMHHFSNLDEGQLKRSAVAAACAALEGDRETCTAQLRAAFDVLTTARERFYPVDCYLLDLCLLIPRLADRRLTSFLAGGVPANLLVSGHDLKEIAAASSEHVAAIRKAWHDQHVEVCGGEYIETTIPLAPLESVLYDFERGRATYQRLLGNTPVVWARRRFGLSPFVPQVLERSGYKAALHFLLDDGIYPDTEYSRFQWEGWSGSVIDGISRIPLAADSATSWLRFPVRLAESMQEDQTAALVLARWPEMTTPWLEDLRRMSKYSPALGRFATFSEFLEYSDSPGRSGHYSAHEYFSPVLTHAVALQEPDPVSRFVRQLQRRTRFDAALWYHATAAALHGERVQTEQIADIERQLEEDGYPEASANAEHVDQLLVELERSAAERLASVILQGDGEQSGYLVLNSLSFARTVAVDLPLEGATPTVGGAVKAVHRDETHQSALVELPPCGFCWIPAGGSSANSTVPPGVPLADENWLRNEFFEAEINEVTGGIRRIKSYGRKPNRLSQQLAFRFPRERTVVDPEGEPEKTYYSEMQLSSLRITSSGPALGEIVTEGALLDPEDGTRLAGFKQTMRVWRGLPWLEINVELIADQLPDGSPWSTYFASRFAWNDSTASLTRSVLEGAQPVETERFESPRYLEIASEEERTTIVTAGQPFFRKSGMRMLDNIVIAGAESQQRFRYLIVLDETFPMRAALSAMTPPAVVPSTAGPPRSGDSGWLFHIDAPQVQLTRILDLDSSADLDSASPDRPLRRTSHGFVVRLLETEGQRQSVKLRCFRTPVKARQRDLHGKTITTLVVHEDYVRVEMSPHELADVELLFVVDETA